MLVISEFVVFINLFINIISLHFSANPCLYSIMCSFVSLLTCATAVSPRFLDSPVKCTFELTGNLPSNRRLLCYHTTSIRKEEVFPRRSQTSIHQGRAWRVSTCSVHFHSLRSESCNATKTYSSRDSNTNTINTINSANNNADTMNTEPTTDIGFHSRKRTRITMVL